MISIAIYITLVICDDFDRNKYFVCLFEREQSVCRMFFT